MTSPAEGLAERLGRMPRHHFERGNPVREAAGEVALSAMVLRLARYGSRAGLALWGSREHLQAARLPVGGLAEQMLDLAYNHAYIEDDRELLDVCADLDLAVGPRTFIADLRRCSREDGVGRLAAAANRPATELAMARLVLARRFPDLIEATWWHGPDRATTAAISGLCQVAARFRADLGPALARFLRGQPAVLYCHEPDTILAPLVTNSHQPPETTLAGFERAYGEQTLVAAAQWHLERGHEDQALALAQQVRPLSRHAESAWLVEGIVAVDRKDRHRALAILARLKERLPRMNLELSILDAWPEVATVADFARLAGDCHENQPETFQRCLLAVLRLGDLETARHLCLAKQETFNRSPAVREVMATILARIPHEPPREKP